MCRIASRSALKLLPQFGTSPDVFLVYFSFLFSWGIIVLQCCIGFCHTTVSISHKCAYIPSLLNLLPPATPSHPSSATAKFFSRVRLCAAPSLGFSRQEHWSGLPFPSPVHRSESEVAQSCRTLRDPMDCSPPGSSVRGIFQARGLERGASAFSAPSF